MSERKRFMVVFDRFGKTYSDDAESFEIAAKGLRALSEHCEVFPIAIYDRQDSTAHIAPMLPVLEERSPGDWLAAQIAKIKESAGVEINEIRELRLNEV